jgi:hypothetical protein
LPGQEHVQKRLVQRAAGPAGEGEPGLLTERAPGPLMALHRPVLRTTLHDLTSGPQHEESVMRGQSGLTSSNRCG